MSNSPYYTAILDIVHAITKIQFKHQIIINNVFLNEANIVWTPLKHLKHSILTKYIISIKIIVDFPGLYVVLISITYLYTFFYIFMTYTNAIIFFRFCTIVYEGLTRLVNLTIGAHQSLAYTVKTKTILSLGLTSYRLILLTLIGLIASVTI
jgi:hypothetical protein